MSCFLGDLVVDVHPSLLERKIIHFDMDAFYAAIEIRDEPSLRGKPVVVGGSPASRGVVCTASYEARRYGIRSAMACAHVARLCPDAIFIRPNFEKYHRVSQQIRTIFAQYTDMIEPLSLDEAYLDVTNNPQGLFAVRIARMVQEEIFESLGLTGSAGVAPNKLIAKIASDIHKPRGLTVVLPEHVERFMESLPLRKIHGVGPVTEKRLASAGLHNCRDVWALAYPKLEAKVGSLASWLYEASRGIDTRPVETNWVRKSLGRESTFGADILDPSKLRAELAPIASEVASDLREEGLRGRTITLKVRYADFTRVTRQRSLSEAIDDQATILSLAEHLLEATDAGRKKIRLLGIAVSNFE